MRADAPAGGSDAGKQNGADSESASCADREPAGVAALSLSVLLVVLPLTLGHVALLALFAASGTYFARLFTLAQYLQLGLGRSALVSGLTLVPWVAAFGTAGQVVGKLGPRFARVLPASGWVVLAIAYAAISGMSFADGNAEVPLLALLTVGGRGLGIQFSTVVGHSPTPSRPITRPTSAGLARPPPKSAARSASPRSERYVWASRTPAPRTPPTCSRSPASRAPRQP